jgi:molybdate/tungstate transport system substrate-binding protein
VSFLPKVLLAAVLTLGACTSTPERAPRSLVVYNAAALTPPFKQLLTLFDSLTPGVFLNQESSPSLEAVRKLTDLGKIPDVLAVADYGLLPKLVLPTHASWYVLFGTNAMVLAYTDRSTGASEITGDNWWQVLQRPSVRVGRSDYTIDPSGYRALMSLQLAERHYRQPGLAARLLVAMPQRYVRHAEADLSALVSAGELDYGWTYESLAKAHGLKYVKLPPEVDLSSPALADWYKQAVVRIPGGVGKDSLTLHGEPIVFALTIPTQAPHPQEAEAFVRLLLSDRGQAVLQRTGFAVIKPEFKGQPPTSITAR